MTDVLYLPLQKGMRMKMQYRLAVTFGVGLSLLACSGMPASTHTGAVQNIVIGPSSFDLNTTVHKDGEVQWINDRKGRIQIIFLDSLEGKVTCKRGFGLWNVVNEATVKPTESVSLCFGQTGSLRYTVRLDQAMSTGWLNAPGRITIQSPKDGS